MAEHNKLGQEGENAALSFLKKRGYSILHCNWRAGKVELDIIAEQENMLVVIEVKTRRDEVFARPEDAISKQKIKNIVKATQAYIFKYDIQKETRFDIISVIRKQDEGFLVRHIKDAFLPPLC